MNANEATLVWADEYSRMAETYDEVVTPRFEPLAKALLELLDPKPGEMILDVSTGTGLLACLIAPCIRPQAVVAIDLADQAIRVASYRAGNAGIRNIRFEMMDARNIVYRSGLFDGIASHLGIPNLGYDRTFHEAHRLLKPGGRFVFNEWDEAPSPAEAMFREALSAHATPAPSKDLAGVREAVHLVRTDPESLALRNPASVVAKLRERGFAWVDETTKEFLVRFANPADVVRFFGAWGWNERELREMPPDRRAAFERDLAQRFEALAGPDGIENRWRLHYFLARP
jgi:ubiquinone/menaquinone biosynthesis C-methylase UbiE